MHKHIICHEYDVTSSILGELSEINFVFICIDNGEAKKIIIEKLLEEKIPFVDSGIGVYEVNGKITGSLRVTTATAEKHDHIDKYISFSNTAEDDVYNKNVQIAELNALNAALAVVKWKKLFGFYHDLVKENNTVYDINTNRITNNENLT